jgi:hypothetical protein
MKMFVSAAEFNSKYRGKPECYRFLSFDVGAYVPPYDDVTVWHLRDLCSGTRKRLKACEVKTINIPQFDGLTIERMLYHARSASSVMRALPVREGEIKKLPRAYIANVMYTIIGEPFRDWVEKKVKDRNEKHMLSQNMTIEMDPEVYKAFKASTHVSCIYHSFCFLTFVL